MMEILVCIGFFILLFALIGVVCTIVWLAKGIFGDSGATSSKNHSRANAIDDAPAIGTETSRVSNTPTLADDFKAARRLLQQLNASGALATETYSQIQQTLLEAEEKSLAANDVAQSRSVADVRFVENEAATNMLSSDSQEVTDVGVPDVVFAEIVEDSESSLKRDTKESVANRPHQTKGKPPVVAHVSAVSPATSAPAPWDVPDPPPKTPRRSFAELMSGFMQEKNMRWGELTSGILIVLSAVGLVVSLQQELSNTIPYFSSLLFLILTSSIIGAGVYTLKKWNLRNTSRGTLIIGLLLIPLNFVAGCILSGGTERRSLEDPLLWTAVILGTASFAFLAWWACCHLFRQRFWPVVLAVVGCGMSTLFINRTVTADGTQLGYLVAALPVIGFFLAGMSFLEIRQWTRRKFSLRSINRMYLSLGVCLFALLSALSMVLVRAESWSAGALAITPILSVACLAMGWIGAIGRNLDIGHETAEVVKQANKQSQQAYQLTGFTLQILGLILIGFSVVASAIYPSLLAINALVAAFGVGAMVLHQRMAKLVPMVWAFFAVGCLTAFHLATGGFEVDRFATLDRAAAALVSSKSGLCLFAIGAIIFLAHFFLSRFDRIGEFSSELRRPGWASSLCIVFCGSLVSLVASFIDRNNVLDAMTASSLLIVLALGLIAASLKYSQSEKSNLRSMGQWLANISAVAFLCGLAHLLLWNPFVGSWFNAFTRELQANWIGVAAIHGVVFASLALCFRRSSFLKSGTGLGKSIAVDFSAWAGLSLFVTQIGAFTIIRAQTGTATLFELVAMIGWLVIGLVWHGKSEEMRTWSWVPWVFSTAVVWVVAMAEIGTTLSWVPPIDELRHWLFQIVGLSVWALAWVGVTWFCNHWKGSRLFNDGKAEFEQVVLYGLVFAVTMIASTALLLGTVTELGAEKEQIVELGINQEFTWVLVAIVAVSVTSVLSALIRPTLAKGAALVCLWSLSWAWCAILFEPAIGVASALRWLLPAGGALGAILVSLRRFPVALFAKPFRGNSESRLTIEHSGEESLSRPEFQGLINLSLAISTIVVLLISSLTVSIALIYGGESLGGPAPESWFKRIPPEVSFGVPIAIVVGTFLLYAISECRTWLATIGSCVFQYIVLLSIVLLFLSPHPELATVRFVNILYAVSLGMTIYGFVWFRFQRRISEGLSTSLSTESSTSVGDPASEKYVGFHQIDVHTLINGLLITSMQVVAIFQFYMSPSTSGGWVNSIGSVLGVVALLAFIGLAIWVWGEKLKAARSGLTWMWISGWLGMMIVGTIAAIIDRHMFVPWATFGAFAAGTIFIFAWQVFLAFRSRELTSTDVTGFLSSDNKTLRGRIHGDVLSPMLISAVIGMLFTVRGALANTNHFWLFALGPIVIGAGLLLLAGKTRRASLGVLAMIVSGILVTVVVFVDPQTWFTDARPDFVNILISVWSAIAIGWSVFISVRKVYFGESFRFPFSSVPGIVLLLGALWLFFASLGQLFVDSIGDAFFANASSLANISGLVAIGTIFVLLFLSIWNRQSRLNTAAGCLFSIAIAITITSVSSWSDSWRGIGVVLAVAVVIAMWGQFWANRNNLSRLRQRLNFSATSKSMLPDDNSDSDGPAQSVELLIYTLVTGGIVLFLAVMAIGASEPRACRYTAAAVPFLLAIGIGPHTNPTARRWLQSLTLILTTLGFLMVAWADLMPYQMFAVAPLDLCVRSLIVLALAVFVYGGLVPRWVTHRDTWLKTLKEMAVGTCILAALVLLATVNCEWAQFQDNVGCGMPVGEGLAVTILVGFMVVGLGSIAIQPKHDPFALSIEGRKAYVYGAQVVAVLLAAHIYLTMPWLFQLGIKEYWPYIAMLACFSGVALGRVLEKRDLAVLGEPLFNSAVVLPIVVAMTALVVETKSDTALVMLTVGLIYLVVGMIRESNWGIIAAFLFGNFALWIFFNRFPDFSIFEHPQLWLIPPAASALIAGQLSRKQMSANQLATLRYVCAAVIYVSSTAEIFTNGIGQSLWPPMVLAALSIAGVFSGMAMRIKSFLYFGSLFLVMAMISMVSHAHQKLDHVWPWWAFGIGTGVAILVVFGLFEKRKNELKSIASQLKQWET